MCRFCGEFLWKLCLPHWDPNKHKLWTFSQHYERCGCEQAKADWEARDKAFQAEQMEKLKEEIRANLRERIAKARAQSNLKERFKARRFSSWARLPHHQMAFEAALDYAECFEQAKQEGIGLLFSGSVGTGKTHLAAAIANHLLERGIPVIFASLGEILDQIKATYQGGTGESETSLVSLYSTVDLLVLDDLGKERYNEWTVEKLFTIINNRYEAQLPVVVTTNYNMDKLVKRLTVGDNAETAQAIVSRIWEMCKGVRMEGPDFRKKQ